MSANFTVEIKAPEIVAALLQLVGALSPKKIEPPTVSGALPQSFQQMAVPGRITPG